MNHFKKHRREITKHFNVRGYEKSVHSDSDTVSLPSSSGILRELKIYGKTEQEIYRGVNLFDIDNPVYSYVNASNKNYRCRITDGVIESAGISGVATGDLFAIDVSGLDYIALSFNAECDRTTEKRTVVDGEVSRDIGADNILIDKTSLLSDENGYIENGYNAYSINVSDYNYFAFGFISNNKYGIKITNLQVEAGAVATEYEPYNGGVSLPNPDLPSDIVSGEEIVIKGVNLFNINEVTACCNHAGASSFAYGTKDGSELVSRMGGYGTSSYWKGAKINIDKSGSYYIAYDCFVDESELYSGINIGLKNIELNKEISVLRDNNAQGVWFSGYAEITIPEEWIGAEVYLVANGSGGKNKYTNMNVRFKNIAIANEKITAYEQYVEPTTIKANIQLCGIDGNNDTLEINFADKTVKVNKKVKSIYIKDLHPGDISVYSGTGNYVSISNLAPWKVGTKAYCTHCKMYDSENYVAGQMCFELISDSTSSTLYFYDVESTTVDEFISYASESNLMVAYVMDTEENIELEYNLSSEILPYNATAVIEVANANGIDAIYYSIERE